MVKTATARLCGPGGEIVSETIEVEPVLVENLGVGNFLLLQGRVTDPHYILVIYADGHQRRISLEDGGDAPMRG